MTPSVAFGGSERFEDVLTDDSFDPKGAMSVKLTEAEWRSINQAPYVMDLTVGKRLIVRRQNQSAECSRPSHTTGREVSEAIVRQAKSGISIIQSL